MSEILTDANNLTFGDFVDEVIDDLTEEDRPSESCHCSIKASVDPYRTQKGSDFQEARVLTHGLLPGDVILKKEEQSEDADCHCDYWWTVSRAVRSDVHPLTVGTRIYHRSQQWHCEHMGGTATIIGVYGPRHDGTFEYRVMTGVDFFRQTGSRNPETRLTDWSSSAVLKASTWQ